VLRWIWHRVTRFGIDLPAQTFLPSPVDRKVGLQFADGIEGPRVLAICDFSVFPLSYDIVPFLASADLFRRQKKALRLDVAFIAHDADPLGMKPRKTDPVNFENYRLLVHNLGLEAFRLFEAAGNSYLFTNRAMFEKFLNDQSSKIFFFPQYFNAQSPSYIPAQNKPPLYGLKYFTENMIKDGSLPQLRIPPLETSQVKQWLRTYCGADKRIITITLRDTANKPERNSRILEWQKLVDHFVGEPDIAFVVLSDFQQIHSEAALHGANVAHCIQAVMSLPFRAALYKEADLNLFVGNGPATLCYLTNDSAYLVFCINPESDHEQVEEWRFFHGIGPGENLPWAGPNQKLVWQLDDFDVLRDEVQEALQKLQSRPEQ